MVGAQNRATSSRTKCPVPSNGARAIQYFGRWAGRRPWASICQQWRGRCRIDECTTTIEGFKSVRSSVAPGPSRGYMYLVIRIWFGIKRRGETAAFREFAWMLETPSHSVASVAWVATDLTNGTAKPSLTNAPEFARAGTRERLQKCGIQLAGEQTIDNAQRRAGDLPRSS